MIIRKFSLFRLGIIYSIFLGSHAVMDTRRIQNSLSLLGEGGIHTFQIQFVI
jgi:hypothetical protein